MKLLRLGFLCLVVCGFSLVIQSCFNDANAVQSNSATELVNDELLGELHWTNVTELNSLKVKDGKKVLVDVYTDWCKWCKVMDEKTFSDEKVMKYLDESFELVKFNAEEKSNIQYKGESYAYVKGGRRGHNTLAAELLDGRLAYPSFVVLDEALNPIKVIRGFKDADGLIEELETISE